MSWWRSRAQGDAGGRREDVVEEIAAFLYEKPNSDTLSDLLFLSNIYSSSKKKKMKIETSIAGLDTQYLRLIVKIQHHFVLSFSTTLTSFYKIIISNNEMGVKCKRIIGGREGKEMESGSTL